jgi:beta-lactamase class A
MTLRKLNSSETKGLNPSYYWFSKNSDVVFAHHEDTVIETASVIKILIMAKLLSDADKGVVSLRKPIKISRRDVGRHGSGIMQHFYLHKSVELYNLLVLMMTVSDNTATNVLIRLLGIDEINKFARDLGLKNTKLLMKKLDFDLEMDVQKLTIGQTTPKEMAVLVDQLINGSVLSAKSKQKAMTIMQAGSTSKVKRRLPLDVRKFGSKTGSIMFPKDSLFVAEAGYIISRDDTMQIFAIFLRAKYDKELPYSIDSENQQKLADIARTLYDKCKST